MSQTFVDQIAFIIQFHTGTQPDKMRIFDSSNVKKWKTKKYLDRYFPSHTPRFEHIREMECYKVEELDIYDLRFSVGSEHHSLNLPIGTKELEDLAIKELQYEVLFKKKRDGIERDIEKAFHRLKTGFTEFDIEVNLRSTPTIYINKQGLSTIYGYVENRYLPKKLAHITPDQYALELKRVLVEDNGFVFDEPAAEPPKEKKPRKEPKPKPPVRNPALALSSKIAAKLSVIEGFEDVDSIRVWVDKYHRVCVKIGDMEVHQFGWKKTLEDANAFMAEGRKHNKAVNELIDMLSSVPIEKEAKKEEPVKPDTAPEEVALPAKAYVEEIKTTLDVDFKPTPPEGYEPMKITDAMLRPLFNVFRNVDIHGFRDDKEYSLVCDFYHSDGQPDPLIMAELFFEEHMIKDEIKEFKPIGTCDWLTKEQLLNLHMSVGYVACDLRNSDDTYVPFHPDMEFDIRNYEGPIDEVVLDHPNHYLVKEYLAVREKMTEFGYPPYEEPIVVKP